MEDRIFDIAGKHFLGNLLTPEEERLFSEWLKKSENATIYSNLQKTWQITEKARKVIVPDIEHEWDRFKTIRANTQKTFRLGTRYILSIAASIVILTGLFIFYQSTRNYREIIIASEQGKRLVQLPDNSKVWLNKNSILKYNEKFGNKNRQITLDGEAYFEVQKSKVPFEIFSHGNIKTQVLGTSFNLRAYKKEPITELTVLTGKVSFGKTNEAKRNVYLKNQRAKLNIENNSLNVEATNNENSIAWQTGIIAFNNTPLDKVASDLSHYFEIKIILPEDSKELKFSGKYTNPSPAELAEILDATFNWTHTLNNETLIFNSTN